MSNNQNKLKVLLLDLETSYLKGSMWSLWKQNINWAGLETKDKYLLSWAAKWLDDEYIYSDALYLHKKAYRQDPTDDKAICETLLELIEQADVIVAHNLKRFDLKRFKTRCILNGLEPPPAVATIDTLETARREFAFASNRLDHLGDLLGVGRKISTEFQDWVDVVDKNCPKAFEKMLKYNEQDVLLLEDVYKKLEPYNTRSFSKLRDGRPRCNSCNSTKVQKWGLYYTPTGTYQKYRCPKCGHNMRNRYVEKTDKETKQSILRSI